MRRKRVDFQSLKRIHQRDIARLLFDDYGLAKRKPNRAGLLHHGHWYGSSRSDETSLLSYQKPEKRSEQHHSICYKESVGQA